MLPSQVNINLAENTDVPDLGRREIIGSHSKRSRPKKCYIDNDDDNDVGVGDGDEALEKLINQPDSPSNLNINQNNYLSPRSSFSYIDDGDGNDSSRRGSQSQWSPHNDHKLSKNIVVVDDVPLCRLKPQSQVAPVFIDHENRQFLNPISYIGGPRLGSPVGVTQSPHHNDRNVKQPSNLKNRKSIDSITSVLSID